MLDRLISGAGAPTDRADRLVRAITSGRGPDVMGNRPGSVFVIVLLIVASVAFGLLALDDGIQDADETGDAWHYWLIDEAGSGVTVRSTRHPDDIYRYTATGVLVRDRVVLCRGPRSVLQLKAGTGTLLLSFDSKEARDRAASELIGEAGLLIKDTGIVSSPG